MSSRISQKKEAKRKALLDSAYTLFVRQGISDTSIAEICEKADVAKGTFYLYFADKEDILRALNARISYELLADAYQYMKSNERPDFVENMVIMAEHFIARFKSDPDMVRMMKKDFVWPIDEQQFMHTDDEMLAVIRTDIEQYANKTGLTVRTILIRLVAMISMISSVCYSCLIEHLPSDLETVEPELYKMIRISFKKEQEDS